MLKAEFSVSRLKNMANALECGVRPEHHELAMLKEYADQLSTTGTKRDLAFIIIFLSEAYDHRIAGNVDIALKREAMAEKLYDKLPGYAQW